MSASDDQSEKECPLCMEAFDLDDLNFYPCRCEYQICRFCWHRLRTDENGLCPACRQPYPEVPVNFKPLTPEEFQRIKTEKKQREQQKKQKLSDSRKHLSKVRVLQKNLVFVIGLPLRFCEPELLKRSEYFGKFGKVHKVVINNTNYAGPSGPSAGIFITYYRQEDALRAIQCVNSVQIDGRSVKASLGTTKYCSNFLRNQPCHKSDCMYLHDIGEEAASFTKEDMQQHKHTDYERRLHEQVLPTVQGSRRFRDSSAQREIWPATLENESADQKKQSEPIPISDKGSTAAGQNRNCNHKHAHSTHGATRNRQPGGRNRNRHNRAAYNGTGTQKHDGDAKDRSSPPASSLSPDRDSLPSTMYSSGSTQGLFIGNGNEGDSRSQSASASPPLFSSSLPEGGASKSDDIVQFVSTQALNDVGASSPAVTGTEIDGDERSISKSPVIDDGQKGTIEDTKPQQLACNGGSVEGIEEKLKDEGNSESASKFSALFSKLLCEGAVQRDRGQEDTGGIVGQGDTYMKPVERKDSEALDWQTALGLKKEQQDDDLGFDPYIESSKALEEMVREEKEMTKRQQQFQHHQPPFGGAPNWDVRNRYRPHQQQHQHQPHVLSGHMRPSNWQHTNPGMAPNQFNTNRSRVQFSPQSPPDHHIPLQRMEFVNSNYGPPPGFGGDVPPHKLNGATAFPQPTHSVGQLRQQPQAKDAFNLKEWQDGFRAILPNVNIKFAPNLSSPHQSNVTGLTQTDPNMYRQKSTGWPSPSNAPRPTSENMFMFNRPPPPLLGKCSYPPPGIRRSPTVESTSVPPAGVNGPQQMPFTRAVSPFRTDYMNWPMDDISPSSHPPSGFMAPPSQQNVA